MMTFECAFLILETIRLVLKSQKIMSPVPSPELTNLPSGENLGSHAYPAIV